MKQLSILRTVSRLTSGFRLVEVISGRRPAEGDRLLLAVDFRSQVSDPVGWVHIRLRVGPSGNQQTSTRGGAPQVKHGHRGDGADGGSAAGGWGRVTAGHDTRPGPADLDPHGEELTVGRQRAELGEVAGVDAVALQDVRHWGTKKRVR